MASGHTEREKDKQADTQTNRQRKREGGIILLGTAQINRKEPEEKKIKGEE